MDGITYSNTKFFQDNFGWTGVLIEPVFNLYKSLINNLCMFNFYSVVTEFITDLDLALSHASVAHKYKYFKPEVTRSETSFFNIKEVRHPLIERIIRGEYITNDLSLNEPILVRPTVASSNELKDGSMGSGLLLYGCNSIGKSVFTESIGMNIIMAQMGMFVPSRLVYSPYSNIMTRLSGQDEKEKGNSSFIVEMIELRHILNNSNQRTLILGDELCRGTEIISAEALTINTLLFLNKKKASHIFSTHMHDIPKKRWIQELTTSGCLKILHMSNIFDPEKDALVCNRKLTEGSGDSIYGLEVAKYVGLDQDFIRETHKIRKELLGESLELFSSKKSRYNPSVFMDHCQMCGSKINLESHHIKEQSKADDDGFVGLTPLHSEYNLLVVCHDCHHKVIHGKK